MISRKALWVVVLLGLISVRASAQTTISSVEVSNITSSSFTVTWVSQNREAGSVSYGVSSGNLVNQLADARTLPASDFYDAVFDPGQAQTHFVQITGLNAATAYYFRIRSGGSLSLLTYQAITAPQSGSVPLPPNAILSGIITARDGVNTVRVPGALVSFYLAKSDGRRSQQITTICNRDGNYTAFTGSSSLTQSLTGYFDFNSTSDLLFIASYGGSTGQFAASYPLPQIGTLASDMFIMQVNLLLQVNLSPQILPAIPAITINEDDSLLYNLDRHEFDPQGNTTRLFWGIRNNATSLLSKAEIRANGSSQSLFIKPVANLSGSGSIKLELYQPVLDLLASQNVTITVTAVNDVPHIRNLPQTAYPEIEINKPFSFQVEASDEDHANSLLSYSLLDAPTGMTISSAGLITWTPAQQQTGIQHTEVIVRDPVGDDDQQPLYVVVLGGKAPKIQSVGNTNGREDAAASLNMTPFISDYTGLLSSLRWQWTPSAHVTVRHDTLTSVATFTPTADWYGTENVFVRVTTRDNLTSNLATIGVTFLPVNDAPVMSIFSPLQFLEDSSGQLNLNDYVSDIDNTDQSLRWSVIQPPTVAISINSQTNIATFTPAPNWSGSVVVSFVVRDDSLAEASGALAVTVQPVNDPPVLTGFASFYSMKEDESFQLNLLPFVFDWDDIQFTWDVIGETHITAEVSAGGRLSITPQLDWYGTEHLSIFVTDAAGLSAVDEFDFYVFAVNDPPRFSPVNVPPIAEGVQFRLPIQVADPEGQAFTVQALTLPTGMTFNAQSRELAWTPQNYQVGQHRVSLSADDGQPARIASTLDFTLTVQNTNNPPTIRPLNNISADEGQIVAFQAVAADSDMVHGETLTFSDNTPIFEINPATGQVNFTTTNAHNGQHNITITVTDKGGLFAQTSFVLTVSNVNDPPKISGFPSEIRFNEDTVYNALDLDDYVADPDDADAALTWQSPSITRLTVAIDPQTHNVTMTPELNFNGTRAAKFIVTDRAGARDSITAAIRILPVNDPPNAFNLLTPANLAVKNKQTVTLDWENSSDLESGAVTYVLRYGVNPSLAGATEVPNISASTFDVSPLIDRTTYYWQVAAQDPDGAQTWTSIWQFRIDLSVPVDLRAFSAIEQPGKVRLEWEVSRNEGLVGFNVYRHELPEFAAAQQLNSLLIIGGPLFEYEDETALADQSYRYWLQAVEADGQTTLFGPVSGRALATQAILLGNRPNPFRDQTTIEFYLPQAQQASLIVYNTAGQLIRELVNGNMRAGRHQTLWDGRDMNGQTISSGVYLSILQLGSRKYTQRLLLVR